MGTTQLPDWTATDRIRLGVGRTLLAHDQGRGLATVVGLTAANLISAAGTYTVFVVMTRRAAAVDVGEYALILAIVLVLVQLSDAGDSLLSARNALTEQTSRALAAGLRRRLALATLGGLVVGLAALMLSGTGSIILAAIALTVLHSFYYYLLVVAQARSDWFWLTAAQVVNGLSFTVGGLLMIPNGASPAQALWVHVIGTVLAFTLLAARARDLWATALRQRVRDDRAPPAVRLSYLRATVAGTLSVHADTLVVGLISATTLATYAAGQRPAAVLLTVVASLHRFALPRLASRDSPAIGQAIRLSWRAALVAPVLAAIAYVTAGPVFSLIYPEGLRATATFALLVGAYVFDAASVVPINVLVLRGRIRSVTHAATIQIFVLLIGSAMAALGHFPIGVALAVSVARFASFALVARRARIAIRDEQDAT